MARKPRLHFPGAVYHVTLRGNDKQDIFFDDEDRGRFYALLQEGVERFGHKIHAFCLMTNHCHLAIQVGEIHLSRIIQNISFRYTVWVNKRQQRSGHLFQGRYKAILVDGEAYLLELVRYIHLNPVRAAMVRLPEEYAWSSHKTYYGEEGLPWVSTDWVLSHFSKEEQEAKKHYKKFLNDGLASDGSNEFNQKGQIDNRVMGDERFAELALGSANERLEVKVDLGHILTTILQYYDMSINQLTTTGKARKESEVRAVAALFAREYGCGTLTELARLFGRDVTTISSAVRRLEKKVACDSELAKQVGAIRAQIAILQA